MPILLSILITVLAAYNTRGAPCPVPYNLEPSPNFEPSGTNQLKRTLFGVALSCFSTTIPCAWTAVHPNVPPRNKWHARWNRLKLMFWMIVAPELMLAWAVRQYFAAKDVMDVYNQKKGAKEWTLSHGHLLSMGGYTLVSDPDGKGKLREPRKPGLLCTMDDWGQYYELYSHYQRSQLGVLTVDEFKKFIEDPAFEFPDITEAEIGDRSNGDGLFKLIVILQTTWFILQCAARGQQRLALTELELVTLALASLNAVTFAIWWHKPLGVQDPVKIYLKAEARRLGDAGRRQDRKFNLSFCDVILRGWRDIKHYTRGIFDFLRSPCKRGPIRDLYLMFIAGPIIVAYIITFPFFVLFPLGIIFLLRVIETESVLPTSQSRGLLAARIVASLQQFRYSLSSAATKFVEQWLKEIFCDEISIGPLIAGWFFLLPLLFVLLCLFAILLTPLVAVLFLVSFIFTAVFGIVTTSTIHPGASHVPPFYASKTNSDRWSRMVVFALFGITFGGVHCIGWNFQYPTHSEQTLWRATSLAITGIPLIVAPIDFLLATQDIDSCQGSKRTILLILDLIMTILLFIYVPARLSLIGQALALLRAQPADAFVAVDWTKYVPHLFS